MTRRYKVAIADFIVDQLETERDILGDIADVVALNALSESDLVGRIEDADAIVLYHAICITQTTIQRLENCKIILRGGVGVDNVDYRFARTKGIPVCNIPDYGTEEVANSAIGMTLALCRGISRLNSMMRDARGEWTYEHAVPLPRLRGEKFGIVGLGRIGTATAMRAKSLGMEVVYYDPYKPKGYDKSLGVTVAPRFESLLEESLVVTLHCPLTEETRRMMDRGAMERMRESSYLINTARGGLVETEAVPEMIRSGRLAGAAIDVLEKEPPREDDPLIRAWRDPNHPAYDRLIINPHAAFYCREGAAEIRTKGAAEIRRALLGEPLANVVNEAVS